MKKIVLIIALFSLTGCATVTLKDTEKITYGLTRHQVVKFLGEPESSIKEGDTEDLFYRLPAGMFSRERYDYYVKLKGKRAIAFGHHAPIDRSEQ
jgi:hypothetical protein